MCPWYFVLIAFVTGAFIGAMVIALCAISQEADRRAKEMRK